MKFDFPKQWCARMAAKEDGGEISAGPQDFLRPWNKANLLIVKVDRHIRWAFNCAYAEVLMFAEETYFRIWLAEVILLVCFICLVRSILGLASTRRELVVLQQKMDAAYAELLAELPFPDDRRH